MKTLNLLVRNKIALAASLLLAGTLASTGAVTLKKGHADIGIAYEDNAWDLHVHDEERDKEYEPGDAILQIGGAAQTTVPNNPAFTNFLGEAGNTIWILPATEDPDLLFLGLGSEEIEHGVFVNNTVKLSLISVSGPGEFAMYSVNGFGVPMVRMNTRNGINTNDAINLLAGGHQHFNMAFSAPGTYTVEFEGSGFLDDGSNTFTSSGPVAYKFVVVAPDTKKPSISITSPLANSTNNFAVTTVSGAAKDDVRVVQVKMSHNDGPFQSITLASNAAVVNWSTNLNLIPGTNIIAVQAVDNVGNESVILTRKFFHNVDSGLTIDIAGVGSVIGKASPIGTPAHGASLLVGRPYEVTAIPGAGYVFSNWTGGVTGENPKLKFIMQSNLVLTAHFIPNPFIPAAGSYSGLFFETNEVTHHSAGLFTAKVKTNFSFSAKLLLDGDAVSFSGKFGLPGTLTKTVTRAKFGRPDLTIDLALNFDSGSDKITGAISTTNWIAELTADLAKFNIGNPPSAFLGSYTMLIPGFTNAADGPTGDGFGSVVVDANGFASVKGYSADGGVISSKLPLSENGQWPFYQTLYKGTDVVASKTYANFKGSLLGWLTLTNELTTNLAPHGTISSIKTAWTNAIYPNGFTNESEVAGSIYTAPAIGTRAIDIPAGTVELFDGNLALSLTNNFLLATNNKIAVTTTNNSLKLTLTPKTGVMSGIFTHPTTSQKTTVRGAVLQEQKYGGGHFLGTTQGGGMLLQGD